MDEKEQREREGERERENIATTKVKGQALSHVFIGTWQSADCVIMNYKTGGLIPSGCRRANKALVLSVYESNRDGLCALRL